MKSLTHEGDYSMLVIVYQEPDLDGGIPLLEA